jgi:hypothetical protein
MMGRRGHGKRIQLHSTGPVWCCRGDLQLRGTLCGRIESNRLFPMAMTLPCEVYAYRLA